jgi:hypothetical protein
MKAQLGMTRNEAFPTPEQIDRLAELPRERMPLQERDEFDAMREAMPDLERLARSRQRRAMRKFIAIKANNLEDKRKPSEEILAKKAALISRRHRAQ